MTLFPSASASALGVRFVLPKSDALLTGAANNKGSDFSCLEILRDGDLLRENEERTDERVMIFPNTDINVQKGATSCDSETLESNQSACSGH